MRKRRCDWKNFGTTLPIGTVSIFFAATQDKIFTANMAVEHCEGSLRNTRQFMPDERASKPKTVETEVITGGINSSVRRFVGSKLLN